MIQALLWFFGLLHCLIAKMINKTGDSQHFCYDYDASLALLQLTSKRLEIDLCGTSWELHVRVGQCESLISLSLLITLRFHHGWPDLTWDEYSGPS